MVILPKETGLKLDLLLIDREDKMGGHRRGEDPIVRPPSWGGSEAYRDSIGKLLMGQEATPPLPIRSRNRAGGKSRRPGSERRLRRAAKSPRSSRWSGRVLCFEIRHRFADGES